MEVCQSHQCPGFFLPTLRPGRLSPVLRAFARSSHLSPQPDLSLCADIYIPKLASPPPTCHLGRAGWRPFKLALLGTDHKARELHLQTHPLQDSHQRLQMHIPPPTGDSQGFQPAHEREPGRQGEEEMACSFLFVGWD